MDSEKVTLLLQQSQTLPVFMLKKISLGLNFSSLLTFTYFSQFCFHLPPTPSWICRCLEPSTAEEENLEYTKQLILSCLLNICQKLSPDGSRIQSGKNHRFLFWLWRLSLPFLRDCLQEFKSSFYHLKNIMQKIYYFSLLQIFLIKKNSMWSW